MNRASEDALIASICKRIDAQRGRIGRSLRNWSETDDAVGEACLGAVTAVRRGLAIRDPNAYAGGIVTIVIKNHIREHQLARRILPLDAIAVLSSSSLSSSALSPEALAIAAEDPPLVKMLRASANRADRRILMEFYVEGRSPAEIQLRMHLTYTQFRLLKSRAKARFLAAHEKGRRKNELFRVFEIPI